MFTKGGCSMKTIKLEFDEVFDEALIKRVSSFDGEDFAKALAIAGKVQANGDAAISKLSEEAGIAPMKSFELSEAEVAAAQAEVDEDFLDALAYAIDSISNFHDRQRRESWFTAEGDGRLLGEQIVPFQRVGIYVDGSRGGFSPDVVTSTMPALVAGVDEVVMCIAPRADGSIDPCTIVAATTLGVNRIFKVGGACAIAAMVYGTETIPRVEKIAGAGGRDVAAMKRGVLGGIGLDGLSGPCEACIMFDGSAIPDFIAIDTLSQLERGAENVVYLVTTAPTMLPEVQELLEGFASKAPDPDAMAESLDRVVVVACRTMTQAYDVVNKIAPARLEVAMTAPIELIGGIQNAGSVFLGPWTPASVGAYVAGPGCDALAPRAAAYTSALSVDDFVKKIPLVSYSFDALETDAWAVEHLAHCEGAWAGVETAAMRLDFMDYVQEELLQAAKEDVDAEGGACCGGHGHGHGHGHGYAHAHDGECECDGDECECGADGAAATRGRGAGKDVGAAQDKGGAKGKAGAQGEDEDEDEGEGEGEGKDKGGAR